MNNKDLRALAWGPTQRVLGLALTVFLGSHSEGFGVSSHSIFGVPLRGFWG
jgi:hypothetical protein